MAFQRAAFAQKSHPSTGWVRRQSGELKWPLPREGGGSGLKDPKSPLIQAGLPLPAATYSALDRRGLEEGQPRAISPLLRARILQLAAPGEVWQSLLEAYDFNPTLHPRAASPESCSVLTRPCGRSSHLPAAPVAGVPHAEFARRCRKRNEIESHNRWPMMGSAHSCTEGVEFCPGRRAR